MGKIIAFLVVLVAALGGAGAGFLLQPPPSEEELAAAAAAEVAAPPDLSAPEIVSMRDLFVVPVLRDGRVWSHVVLTLGVESHTVSRDEVLAREPLLRDGLNETLFLHASLGGFDGDFTAAASMNRLRARLDGVVTKRLDDPAARVLIISMARQNG
ncbi:flagellar basal body-associated protein FliL [Jannaschia sp. M317]|uniref:flagellar basal body-associated protein FliL n=1 Tax=Jannaschia sp. M317 TaxID=2867011 RepID=UPI0021A61F06|nr:flagellar basal body-associated protein FliL [Jannaschia sp. M317]UWQ18434.1 flagellar basal body-associated protein FliL [Jannaschia sp. M317]